MLCRSCGKNIYEGRKKCPKCGKTQRNTLRRATEEGMLQALIQLTQPPAPPVIPPTESVIQPEKTGSKQPGRLAVGIGSLKRRIKIGK